MENRVRMKNKVSGNFILCNHFDDNDNTISGIFDTLYLSNDLRANFCVVFQVNIYSQDNYIENKYHLYVFLKENKSNIFNILYLGKINLPPKDEKNHTYDQHSHRHRQIYNFDNFDFLTTGSYVFECYVTEETFDEENIESMYTQLREKGFLLDTLTFNVQIKAQ